MTTKHYCKKCFRAGVDQLASDRHLLMSNGPRKCEGCSQFVPVVLVYYKYGEHTVTEDGMHVVGAARHVGVNPEYSHWGNTYPYAE